MVLATLMPDLLWDIVTSWWTLAIGGGLSAAGFIAALVLLGPAVVLPAIAGAIKALAACQRCLAVLAIGAAAYGGFLVGANGEADRCDAQRAADREAAEKARVTRDNEIRADLESDYRPRLARLADLAKALQNKVDDYAKHPPAAAAARPKAAAGGGVCRLGDAAYRLRPQQR